MVLKRFSLLYRFLSREDITWRKSFPTSWVIEAQEISSLNYIWMAVSNEHWQSFLIDLPCCTASSFPSVVLKQPSWLWTLHTCSTVYLYLHDKSPNRNVRVSLPKTCSLPGELRMLLHVPFPIHVVHTSSAVTTTWYHVPHRWCPKLSSVDRSPSARIATGLTSSILPPIHNSLCVNPCHLSVSRIPTCSV